MRSPVEPDMEMRATFEGVPPAWPMALNRTGTMMAMPLPARSQPAQARGRPPAASPAAEAETRTRT
jgi:hypothetical protein